MVTARQNAVLMQIQEQILNNPEREALVHTAIKRPNKQRFQREGHEKAMLQVLEKKGYLNLRYEQTQSPTVGIRVTHVYATLTQ